jgi:hypothetical protein
LYIENGAIVFDKTAAGSDNRMYRKLAQPLIGFPWTLTFECAPTSIHNGVGACMYLGLTANKTDGQCLPFAQTNEPLLWSQNTLLRVTFDNEYEAGANNCGFNVLYRKNKAMDWTTRKWAYTAPINNGIYYVKLEKTSANNCILNVYDDAAQTHNVSGTPLNISIPTEIDSFNYLQIGAYNEGITDRKMSATIRNIQLTNVQNLSPPTIKSVKRRPRYTQKGCRH